MNWIFCGAFLLLVLRLDNVVSLESDGASESNDELIKNMTAIFKNDFEFQPSLPKPSHSSKSGEADDNLRKIDIQDTPAFKEVVMMAQRQVKQKITGVPNQALLEELQKPRCGISDPPTDENAPGAYTIRRAWSKFDRSKGNLELTYSFMKRNFPPETKLIDRDVRIGLLSAMCLWEWSSNVRFTKDMGDDNEENADIKIGFMSGDHGDNMNFDGPGGKLAHGFYPSHGGLHFDIEEPWFLATKDEDVWDKRDVFTVAAHELGHNLGLDHTDEDGIMSNTYHFRGAFANFEMPRDDVNGMAEMYGYHYPTNPENEPNTACRTLATKYRLRSLFYNKNTNPTKRPTQNTRRTTTKTEAPKSRSTMKTSTARTRTRPRSERTRSPKTKTIRPRNWPTTKTTRLQTPKIRTSKCGDYFASATDCKGWSESGYCTDPDQRKTLSHICKKTCGFCAEEPSEYGKATDSICNAQDFDAIVPTHDTGNFFASYYVKDGFYTKLSVWIGDYPPQASLLRDNAEVADSVEFRQDPIITKPGTFKLENLWSKTKNVASVMKTGLWYLVFDGEGSVDQYYSYTKIYYHVKKHKLNVLFKNYTYGTVDAAYFEEEPGIYTLFKGSQMWQYKENDPYKLSYQPIQERFGVDISQWHGVGACNIDSVFKYKDTPYFVKGTLFWSATDSLEPAAWDITYQFFRCWEGEQKTYDVPKGCAKLQGRSGVADTCCGSKGVVSSVLFIILSVLSVVGFSTV